MISLMISAMLSLGVFGAVLAFDKRPELGWRIAAAAFFAAGSFIFASGSLLGVELHDGLRLPDDERGEGWESVSGFFRMLFFAAAFGFVPAGIGFGIRALALRQR